MSNSALSHENITLSAPEKQGVDSGKLAELITAVKEKKLNIRSILIARNGFLVLETYFHPFKRQERTVVASITKSVISCLIGIAIDKGYIKNIDQRVIDIFSDYNIKNINNYKKDITLRHLLTMSSGMVWDDGEAQTTMMSQRDCTEFILNKPVVEKPGTVFNYNTGGVQLLSVLIAKTTGMSTCDFAKKHLFNPLHITDFEWKTAPDGITAGGNLLFLRPRDLLKFGQLFLNSGNWNGRQIVPAAWVRESTKNRITPSWSRTGGNLGYGYLWWNFQSHNKTIYYSAEGYGGQIILVSEDKQLVTVITAHITGDDMMDIPSGIFSDHIMPAVISDKAIPVNQKKIDLLSSLSKLAENPKSHGLKTLPKTAVEISNNTYYFKANPSKLASLKINFKNKREVLLTLDYEDGSASIPVGLDNVYRTSVVRRLVQKVDYFYDFIEGKVSFKGEWISEDVFLIHMMPIKLSVFTYYMKLVFKKDKINLTVYRKEFPDIDLNLNGETAKTIQ